MFADAHARTHTFTLYVHVPKFGFKNRMRHINNHFNQQNRPRLFKIVSSRESSLLLPAVPLCSSRFHRESRLCWTPQCVAHGEPWSSCHLAFPRPALSIRCAGLSSCLAFVLLPLLSGASSKQASSHFSNLSSAFGIPAPSAWGLSLLCLYDNTTHAERVLQSIIPGADEDV